MVLYTCNLIDDMWSRLVFHGHLLRQQVPCVCQTAQKNRSEMDPESFFENLRAKMGYFTTPGRSIRAKFMLFNIAACARHIVQGRIIKKRKESNDDSGREHSVDSGQSGRTVRPRSSSVLRSPELSTADLHYYSSSPLCVESVLLVRRS